MGYGIFGQKITGIRDIKTPPNGASFIVPLISHPLSMQASAQLQLYQYSSTPLNLVDPVDGLSGYYTLVHKKSLLSGTIGHHFCTLGKGGLA